MNAYLRPYPNTNSAGSQTSEFSLPSRRNLSGRKRSGSGYRSGSCRHALHFKPVSRLSKPRRGVVCPPTKSSAAGQSLPG